MPHSLHYTNFLIRQSQIPNAALPRCRTAALSCDFLLKNLFISKILIIFAFKYWHICNELCQE
jgi:hypothetical protein